MRKALFVGLVVGAVAGWASELRVSIIQGSGIRTFTGSPGGKYSVQCPNIDGGAGQRVAYRPGCPVRSDGGVTCVIDAGLGDVVMDFTTATGSQDPYRIDLAPAEDRIHLRNYDDAIAGNASTTPVYCDVFRRNP